MGGEAERPAPGIVEPADPRHQRGDREPAPEQCPAEQARIIGEHGRETARDSDRHQAPALPQRRPGEQQDQRPAQRESTDPRADVNGQEQAIGGGDKRDRREDFGQETEACRAAGHADLPKVREGRCAPAVQSVRRAARRGCAESVQGDRGAGS